MEVQEMEGESESHMTSAAAFVEGGIQESCDDACSICLEEFCESDPSTVTTCKHEFHLQCILEWCQRSSQCPMCWQPISLKDPTSQELFEAVEQERKLRVTPSRNAAIFRHPALGDFELQHLRMGVNDADFEERIIQHLAAAAAMGRTHHLGRREGHRTRSSGHGHPHFLVFSTQPIAPSSGPDSAAGRGNEPAAIPTGSPSTPITSDGDEPSQQIPHLQPLSSSSSSGSTFMATNHLGINSKDRGSIAHSSSANQDRAGPSELQSFSDSLRSRLNAMSMRYKESISKGARGWKERLFSRSSSMSELAPEARGEVNAGITSVSRLMESLEIRENNRAVDTSLSNHLEDCNNAEASNQNNVEASGENSSRNDNTRAACSAGSHSN
ncbi:E3 ubiquitin-protein ligase RHF2A-like [Gastrolobium bilobum]|uniref:E3 ubiquitin-protein ligase RHF2A-like n=1 Tax=Gastrolobium bilobum TaxID=150636 RepID=UPI002AB04A86|nr:E3 ubiquitin-protein ligase RHF2A-like [Gastrolobium bilobum]XP_061372117.1 E3 ubiquitin-protein ligase RHF2A-like [Gastrolobium bilobum]XP_061372118.1 E3 ubiquitin-protein ligase RHF2A-like [Gastrolobium bilobum]